ncbi:MAG: hypothetical protein LV481_05290 [Methylacidiphilales bacterium]|nr:hypothetical protein [Candidatus Methylacidiphilales bacterium]
MGKPKRNKLTPPDAKPPRKAHQLTVEFSEEHWRWLQLAAQACRLEPGNILKLALHRFCERFLIEKSRLVSWQAHEFVKSRLGNKIHLLVKEGETLLDNPAEISKLLETIVATDKDLAEWVGTKRRHRDFGALHFEGGFADVSSLEPAFCKVAIDDEVGKQEIKDSEHFLLQDCHGQVERDFLGFVEAYKARYAAMPRLRQSAKRKLTPLLRLLAKGIKETKKELEELVVTLNSAESIKLQRMLEKYPKLFPLKRKEVLLNAKASLNEKKAILISQVKSFSRRLDSMKDPSWKHYEAALHSKRSSLLLDDPIELARFLDKTVKDSILSPEGAFWHIDRVAEQGF